jgi:hypothetical protein
MWCLQDFHYALRYPSASGDIGLKVSRRPFISANDSFWYRQLTQRYARNVVPAPRSLPGFLLGWTPCIIDVYSDLYEIQSNLTNLDFTNSEFVIIQADSRGWNALTRLKKYNIKSAVCNWASSWSKIKTKTHGTNSLAMKNWSLILNT